MSTPFIGEIRTWPINFAPIGWAFCQGQLLPISQYDALFALIGTTYGGDGVQTFGLPNLQSRIPIHAGTGPGGTTFVQGQSGGVENVQLQQANLPSHSHTVAAATHADSSTPKGTYFGQSTVNHYGPPTGVMNANVVSMAGGNLPHENRMPYLALNFIIALEGIFPSRG